MNRKPLQYICDWEPGELFFVWDTWFPTWRAIQFWWAEYARAKAHTCERFQLSIVQKNTVNQILENYQYWTEEYKKHVAKQMIWILCLDDTQYMQ